MQETWIRSLGQEDPLEKEMATHSSILAWEIPPTQEPGGLQSMGSQESDTGHDLATKPRIETEAGFLSFLGSCISCLEWNLGEWFIFYIGSFFFASLRKAVLFFLIVSSMEACRIGCIREQD